MIVLLPSNILLKSIPDVAKCTSFSNFEPQTKIVLQKIMYAKICSQVKSQISKDHLGKNQNSSQNSQAVHRSAWRKFKLCRNSASFFKLFLQVSLMQDNWEYHKFCSGFVLSVLWDYQVTLGLLGNSTVRRRNIDMDQYKLLSHRHQPNIFHSFYLKCTSIRNNHRWINLFYYIGDHQQKKLSVDFGC